MLFFEDLYYCVSGGAKPNLDGISFPTISLESRTWLEMEFEEDGVLRALEECGGDKAPGLDGFNFNFIRARWDFIKEDFGIFLSEFHQRGRIIPKVHNPVELTNCRPISLVG